MKFILDIFVLFSVIHGISGFDVIRESFKYIDEKVSPCDNFYRHACPLDSGNDKMFIETAYEEKIKEWERKSANAVWNNLEFEKVLRRTYFKELPSVPEFISQLFKEQCHRIGEREINENLLRIVQDQILMRSTPPPDCQHTECLAYLASDRNCSRASEILEQKIEQRAISTSFTALEQFTSIMLRYNRMVLEGAISVVEGELWQGVEEIRRLVNQVVEKVIGWVKETSWAVKNEAEYAIIKQAGLLQLYDNFGVTLRKQFNILLTFEENYLKCLRNMSKKDDRFQAFCFAVAFHQSPLSLPDFEFFTIFNAMNGHPNVFFSSLFYDMAQNIQEPAAILGSVGFVVGHEISHTLIENGVDNKFLPYFSNESVSCVQDQYQRACDVFNEGVCGAKLNQIDENGSDILGFQLAYSIFEEQYEGRIQEEYISISGNPITMQQLFFYSNAFMACQKTPLSQQNNPHSPWHLRVNVMAQHPAFKEAFQCGPETPMMSIVKEQCIIYGEGAPQNKRKLHL